MFLHVRYSYLGPKYLNACQVPSKIFFTDFQLLVKSLTYGNSIECMFIAHVHSVVHWLCSFPVAFPCLALGMRMLQCG